MSSRHIFILLLAVTIALTVMAAWMLPVEYMWWMIGGLCLVGGIEIWLYVALVRPVGALTNGIGLIKAQDFSSRLSKVGQIDADRLVETFNRMMDVLKTERLRFNERNNFLHLLIDASPAGIVVGDFDGNVTDFNPAAVDMFGVEPTGLTLSTLPGDLGRACAALERGGSVSVRLSNTDIYRCSMLSFMESGFQRPFFLIERLTREVQEAERQACHRIVRTMAHEVNNTMGGVATILEILAQSTLDEAMGQAVEACMERCRALCGFVTDYASVVRLPAPEAAEVVLADMLAGIYPFLEGIIPAGSGIVLEPISGSSEARALVDRTLFQQVMVNIVKNASESIVSSGNAVQGRISVSIGDHPSRIVVADNGPGLSSEASRLLFSPFFTTKPKGQGIGLMLVSEILRAHGCRFSLATDPRDHMTRFSITFPPVR